MQEEIEVKFLNVDFDEVRRKLTRLGGECKQPMQLMKRAVMDYPDERLRNTEGFWSWIRVRDEGSRTMVTFKQVAKEATLQTHEIEYEASSYEKAVATFEAIGLKKWSEQESKRETWECQGCEIMLDEWPWLSAYVEIEGPSEQALQVLTKALGLDWSQHVLGGSDVVYRMQYPRMKEDETVGFIPELTFSKMPDWLKERQ